MSESLGNSVRDSKGKDREIDKTGIVQVPQ
jgi:hypothetical protein